MAVEKQGLQIDLDAGEGQIIGGSIVDDIRSPCTQLEIIFESSEKLAFSTLGTNYLSYFAISWVPITFSECMCPDGRWHYEMSCLPYMANILIQEAFGDIGSLASFMNVILTENSSAMPIEFPTINLTVGEYIMELRRREFDNAFNKGMMGEAWMLYFNSNSMMSMTWSKMLANKTKELMSPAGMQGSNTVMSVDSHIKGIYESSKLWAKWNQADYLRRMLGEFIEIETPTPAVFLDTYTMSFADGTEFQRNETYLCVRVERDVADITKQNELFAKVEHLEGYDAETSAGA